MVCRDPDILHGGRSGRSAYGPRCMNMWAGRFLSSLDPADAPGALLRVAEGVLKPDFYRLAFSPGAIAMPGEKAIGPSRETSAS